jgi:glyoxylase-like metal-dependent hydrolase (beta-lactamase superfamily II)
VRRKLIAISIAALIGIAGAVIQLKSTEQQQPQPLDIQKVKENLYVIIGSGGNVAVRVTTEGVIVIDDKFERDYANIIDKIKSVTNQPVKYVINTHQHGDHTGGNAQFLKIAEIISHKNARDNMAKANMPGLARIVFTDQTAVHLGGVEVQAHYMGRGHTNGDAVIYYPDLGVVHAGDLVNEAGPFADYSAFGTIQEWTKTFDNILKLKFDTLIPGHGKVMTRADFQKFRNNMETFVQRFTQLVRQGTKKEEMAAKFKVDDLGWTLAPNSMFVTRSLSPAFDEAASRR